MYNIAHLWPLIVLVVIALIAKAVLPQADRKKPQTRNRQTRTPRTTNGPATLERPRVAAQASRNDTEPPPPTTKAPLRLVPILTPTERLFYEQLTKAVTDGISVLCKVRLADTVANHQSWFRFNPHAGQHFDFLLCATSTMFPLAAVELDDPSHEDPSAQTRDAKKNDFAAEAGLPLIRIATATHYDPNDLADTIANVMRVSVSHS